MSTAKNSSIGGPATEKIRRFRSPTDCGRQGEAQFRSKRDHLNHDHGGWERPNGSRPASVESGKKSRYV